MPPDRKHITSVLEKDEDALNFIHGNKKVDPLLSGRLGGQVASQPATRERISRRKISIRLPKDLEDLLSQVWHERGLAHTQGKLLAGQVREKQDIIAEALREWLERRGYLEQKGT